MNTTKYVGILIAVAVVGYWIMPDLLRVGTASAETANDVMYLCKETKKLVQAPPQPVPAVNPETGKPTLYRALYCGECKKWKPVPPPDVFPGNPLTYKCPKHHRQMTATGPADQSK